MVRRSRSFIFLKLTDSALQSIQEHLESLQNGKSTRPTIQFQNDTGVLVIPKGGHEDNYSFSLQSNEDEKNFECVTQQGESLYKVNGSIQKKMFIRGREDSFVNTRLKMEALTQQQATTKILQTAGIGAYSAEKATRLFKPRAYVSEKPLSQRILKKNFFNSLKKATSLTTPIVAVTPEVASKQNGKRKRKKEMKEKKSMKRKRSLLTEGFDTVEGENKVLHQNNSRIHAENTEISEASKSRVSSPCEGFHVQPNGLESKQNSSCSKASLEPDSPSGLISIPVHHSTPVGGMKSSHHFSDQLCEITGWFDQWDICEQTVALYSLIKKIEAPQARFLAVALKKRIEESTEQEKESSDPGSSMKSSHPFSNQLSAVTIWFEEWDKNEQNIGLYSLIKKIKPKEARFLALALKEKMEESTEQNRMQEQKANDPGKSVHVDSREEGQFANKADCSNLPIPQAIENIPVLPESSSCNRVGFQQDVYLQEDVQVPSIGMQGGNNSRIHPPYKSNYEPYIRITTLIPEPIRITTNEQKEFFKKYFNTLYKEYLHLFPKLKEIHDYLDHFDAQLDVHPPESAEDLEAKVSLCKAFMFYDKNPLYVLDHQRFKRLHSHLTHVRSQIVEFQGCPATSRMNGHFEAQV